MYSLRSHNRLEIVQMAKITFKESRQTMIYNPNTASQIGRSQVHKSPEKVQINGFKCIVIVQLKYGYFVIKTVTIYLAQVYEPGRHRYDLR